MNEDTSPEVIVLRLEEKLEARAVEDVLEVGERNEGGGHGELHEVGRVLLVDVVDDLRLLRHPRRPTGTRATTRPRTLLVLCSPRRARQLSRKVLWVYTSIFKLNLKETKAH